MGNLVSKVISSIMGGVSVYQPDTNTLIIRYIVSGTTSHLPMDLGCYIKTGGNINNLKIQLNLKGYRKLRNGFIVILDGKQELGRVQVTKDNKIKTGWVIDDIAKEMEQYNKRSCEEYIVKDFY